MLHEAIAAGATIEAAVDAAKLKLNAPWDANVEYEVLEIPQKKTFGLFGGSDAKVRVYYESADKKEASKAAAVPEKKKPAEKKVSAQNEAKTIKETQQPRQNNNARAEQQKPGNKTPPEIQKTAVENDSSETYIYLNSILKGMGIGEFTVKSEFSDSELFYDVLCDSSDYGFIIGRKGETLDAIQFLLRLVTNKANTGDYKRVSLNVGDYRSKRYDVLRSLAIKNAEKAVKYGKNISLEPMSPYERRIIHTAVQDVEGAASHSVGFNNERRVIITPKDGARSGGGYGGGNQRFNNNRNDGGNGGNFNRNNNSGKRPQPNFQKPTADDNRAPKKDPFGSALYGKIETKSE
ncbi:MAG: Jag N-terminal domain-containing protein [Oscillospiraceae bacterium]|nr:Jag N-terminal domain-containing protein [Oscillospiraceae bacterium]